MDNGINIDLIDKLIIDIIECSDDISKTFNDIDIQVSETLNFMPDDLKIRFNECYSDMSDNYKIVNTNILSYSTDYAKLKDAYITRGINIVKQINTYNSDVKVKEKYEEEIWQ